MIPEKIRIGTRGSRLARTQADMVAKALKSKFSTLDIEILVIKTSGDWHPNHGETRLSEAEGGKGLFAHEIEQALMDGRVDCGVHSAKDMPSFLPEDLIMHHFLKRADPRDVLISNKGSDLNTLPQGAVIGTSSLRRQAMALAKRPDLKVVPFRGNVPTRLEKVAAGQVDATFLAYAGLTRLGLLDPSHYVLSVDEMLPAAGQGAIGIELRRNDTHFISLFDAVYCHETSVCVAAERGALQALDGACRTPVGAFATLQDHTIHLKTAVYSEDGKQVFTAQESKVCESIEAAARFGFDLGARLKPDIPPGLLS